MTYFTSHFRTRMTTTPDTEAHRSYQGQLLIAMPGLSGEDFEHSVIYLCQHEADHAMGLVLNHPIQGLNFGKMMKELGLEAGSRILSSQKIFRGGPVQNDRGFVLHSLDYEIADTTLNLGEPFIQLPNGQAEGVGLTASRDILVDLSKGGGPSRTLIALGYAGWGAGQLEDEMARNAWLIAPATQELLFLSEPEQLWTRALASLGIAPEHLSDTAGRA